MADGSLAGVTSHVAEITGHPARTVEQTLS